MAVKIYAINIGSDNAMDQSGDAILIENNGLFGLIDAGGCSSKLAADQYGSAPVSWVTASDGDKVRPFLRSKGVVELEWFIITHFHSDHAWWASQVIDEFKPKKVYGFNAINMGNNLAPVEYKTNADAFYNTNGFMQYTMEALARQNKSFINPTEGQYIPLGDASFNFLNTDAAKDGGKIGIDYNYASLMVLMTYGTTKVMFMSDSRYETSEKIITNIVGKVDVAFASHHGIVYNSSEKLVSTLRPAFAVFTKWRNWGEESSAQWYQYLNARLIHFDADYSIPICLEINTDKTVNVISGAENRVGSKWFKWSNEWYYFDAAGNLAKGWTLINGGWYMFNSTYGTMRKGWYQDTTTEWYYLSPSTVTVGGVTFKEGQMQYTTWIQGANGWYWLKSDGKMARNTKITIGSKEYIFDADGVCLNP